MVFVILFQESKMLKDSILKLKLDLKVIVMSPWNKGQYNINM